jgi:two-component system sensor histidine kinase/response regulator
VDYLTKPFNQAEMLSRVRTHRSLKAAHDRLKQLAEDKDELLGILAHDLKNHIGGIQMSASLLRDRMAPSVDTKSALLCENICRSSSQMLSFVREFLANAAAEHGMVFKLEPVNLGEAVARSMESCHEAAGRKNLELLKHFPAGPVLVLADQNALRQVLDNLLSNAVKFSTANKQINVTLRQVPGGVECAIQDQGPGFTDRDKAVMFRRYGRLSARPTGGEPSTGLGLSIVKKHVLAMNGEIACDSTPGTGTTFTIRLPQPAISQ